MEQGEGGQGNEDVCEEHVPAGGTPQPGRGIRGLACAPGRP